MNKAERAIRALRECADALDDLPAGIQRYNIWTSGPYINSDQLRGEATHLENKMLAFQAAVMPVPRDTTVENY